MMQGKPEGDASDHREWQRDARPGSRRSGPLAAEQPAGHGQQQGRRHFRNIRLHRQFAPLLVAITLLCTVGLAGLAYVGARADAISGAEAQALQDVQVERQIILPQGAALQLQDGRLVLTGPGQSTPLVLNNDTTLVDQTRSLTGDHATIYQAEGSRLVAISTTLPAADTRSVPISGSRALGDVLTGSAFDTVQGGCAPTTPPSGHSTYQGTITVRGLSYAAALVPLYDSTGAYVGALSMAAPLDAVTAPAVQLAMMLLIAGLLLALLALVAGFWLFGALAGRTFGALDQRLRLVADSAAELERLAQLQATRAARQDRVAQQIVEQARSLDAMAVVMEQGRASLHTASGDVWAEMSQPGALPDSGAAVRLAQQAAVSAAQVGSAAEDARDVCGQLVGLMNHVIAEGAIVGNGGLEMEARAKDLRVALESVEITVGGRLLRRSLFLQRVRAASERVRHFLPAPFGYDSEHTGAAESDEPPAPTWRPSATGQYRTPRNLPPQARRPNAPQQPHHQQHAPGTPPRLSRTGELPPVRPGERPGSSGHLGGRPGSGLLSGGSGRGSAEASLPRRVRPPQDPPRDDQLPGDSRHSGW